METTGFYTIEELEEAGINYKNSIWKICVLNAIDVEIEHYISNQNWFSVFTLCKDLIGENFNGEKARQIHIYGDPTNTDEEYRKQFLPSTKPCNYKHSMFVVI